MHTTTQLATVETTSKEGSAVRITSEPEFRCNTACRFHGRSTAASYQWYIRYGSFHTRCRGRIQRFRCSDCGTTCSTQTFSVHYWSHSTNDLLGRLEHHCTSSRAARTTANALFALNYVDREIRKYMSEHVRETVRQGREVNSQMKRMAIFMMVHNFLIPHRVDGRACAALSRKRAELAEVNSDSVRRQLERMVTHRQPWGHCHGRCEWIERIWKHRGGSAPDRHVGAHGQRRLPGVDLHHRCSGVKGLVRQHCRRVN